MTSHALSGCSNHYAIGAVINSSMGYTTQMHITRLCYNLQMSPQNQGTILRYYYARCSL